MTRGESTPTVPEVSVGDFDPMSFHARRTHLPLCRRAARADGVKLRCSRLAGHDETPPPHPATKHVAAGPDGTARAVWHA